VASRLHYLRMDGRETFKNAVMAMGMAAQEALALRTDVSTDQVHHSAPGESPDHRGGGGASRCPARKVYMNVDRFGNTSAASVAIALDEAVRGGRVQRGTCSCCWFSGPVSPGELR
jgi:3-oxoacyl-[acyl-carrier-protein] synthase-3